MTKGIHEASHSPVVRFVNNWTNELRSSPDSPLKYSIWIIYDDHQPYGAAAESLGTVIQMLGRFVPEPEHRPING